jgi:hypothetical protein
MALGKLFLKQWRDAAGRPLAQKLIPHLIVKRTSDDAQVLHVRKHVTSSDYIDPILALFDEALVPGVEYEAKSLEDDGSVISVEVVTAE